MCGVFYIQKIKKLDHQKLSWKYLNIGPDGKKFVETNEVVLGHRLLAVRDSLKIYTTCYINRWKILIMLQWKYLEP